MHFPFMHCIMNIHKWQLVKQNLFCLVGTSWLITLQLPSILHSVFIHKSWKKTGVNHCSSLMAEDVSLWVHYVSWKPVASQNHELTEMTIERGIEILALSKMIPKASPSNIFCLSTPSRCGTSWSWSKTRHKISSCEHQHLYVMSQKLSCVHRNTEK